MLIQLDSILFYLFLLMQTPLRKTFNNSEYLARSRRCDNKCVCDICICGKHKCPERGQKFDGQTTNNQFYKPYNIVPQKRQKVQQKLASKHYDPQMMKSSYNLNYTPHRIERRPNVNKTAYEPSNLRLQKQTEYNKNYSPHKINPQKVQQPRGYIPNTAKFEGATTYNRQYSPKKAELSPSRRRNEYNPNTTPFQGKTTYGSEFKPYKLENRPQTNNRSYIPNSSKFQGQSRYREFYRPYNIEPKERCPTEYLPQRPSRCSPGKTHLNFSAEKDAWE